MNCPYGHEMDFMHEGHRFQSRDYDTVMWRYEYYHCPKCYDYYYVTIR